MSKSDRALCEIKIEGVWQPVTAAEAHTHHRKAQKRCPSCHGALMTRGNYALPVQIGLSHRKTHDGCPLMPSRFKGTPSPHPQALT